MRSEGKILNETVQFHFLEFRGHIKESGLFEFESKTVPYPQSLSAKEYQCKKWLQSKGILDMCLDGFHECCGPVAILNRLFHPPLF